MPMSMIGAHVSIRGGLLEHRKGVSLSCEAIQIFTKISYNGNRQLKLEQSMEFYRKWRDSNIKGSCPASYTDQFGLTRAS